MRTLDITELLLGSASRLLVAAWVLTLSASWIPPSASAGGGVALPSLAPMIKVASPAVVNIATRGVLTERVQHKNPLLQRAERAHRAASQVSERRIRRDRGCAQGLHRHEPARHRERQRDHRHLARQPASH